jgi:hypothetical protein
LRSERSESQPVVSGASLAELVSPSFAMPLTAFKTTEIAVASVVQPAITSAFHTAETRTQLWHPSA